MIIPINPDNQEESFETILQLFCVCGHKLYHHAYVWSGYGEYQYITASQCVLCDDCEEFEWERA